MAEFTSEETVSQFATQPETDPEVQEEAVDPDEEVLECARYGEPDDLRAYLQQGADVNHTDPMGNTALHKAAANGEMECLSVLKEFNAIYRANNSGNYPLHWAAMNQKVEAARFLLREFDVDVLAQNRFGRSALTEAFATANTELVNVILEHSSASEERLQFASGGKTEEQHPPHEQVSEKLTGEADEDETARAEIDISNAIEHEFCLLEGLTFKVRELPIARADNPFGATAAEDSTGMGVWAAALLLSQWCVRQRELFENRVVIELGAGCGVPGLCVATHTGCATVYLSDVNAVTLRNLQHNAALNAEKFSGPVEVVQLDWSRTETWPEEPADVILGADLVYSRETLPLLASAVSGLLKPSGIFLYVAPEEGRDGLEELQSQLSEQGLHCVTCLPAPEEYFVNPLASEDTEAYLLYFMDLAMKAPHTLYTFQKA